jgi:hypothetical protein
MVFMYVWILTWLSNIKNCYVKEEIYIWILFKIAQEIMNMLDRWYKVENTENLQ